MSNLRACRLKHETTSVALLSDKNRNLRLSMDYEFKEHMDPTCFVSIVRVGGGDVMV